MLRFASTCILVVLAPCLSAQSLASPVTYTIDPTQSTMSATGTLSGNIPSAQTSGSNLTTYNGTISADRTATAIQFTLGSAIDADQQPSKQQPGLDGEAGSAFADYGIKANNSFGTTFAAFRDLIFDLYSDPLTVASNGNFPGSFDIVYAGGNVDWNTGFQWNQVDFTGRDLFNASPNGPNVTVANGIETLTLPIRFNTVFSTQNSGDSNIRLSGTIVATRSLTNTQPQWKTNGGGSWNDPANWDGAVPNGTSAAATFLGALTAANSPAIVTLNGNHTVGSLSFDNPNTYEIAPGSAGTLTLGDASTPATITVANGRHIISAPLTLAGNTTTQIALGTSLSITGSFFNIADNQSLTTTGPGLLIISGQQSHGPGTTLNVLGGEIRLQSNAGHPAVGPVAPQAPLAIRLLTGASHVVVNADQDLQSLDVNFNAPDTQGFDLNSPTTAGAFRSVRIYDITDASKQSIYAAMSNAHTNPSDGIYDSGLAAHPSSALGLASTSGPQGGKYLLMRPTRIGDINLDGIVTIGDFIDLASNFGHSGPDITWQEGDLNYDNAVTISDFIDLASNFGNSYAGDLLPISDEDQNTLRAFASAHGITLVPEPSALALILLTIAAASARRLPRASCPCPD